MKLLLLLSLVISLPGVGFGETIYRNRVYREGAPVQRVTTVRTTTYPSIDVYRSWDRRREYMWNDQRYYWDGTAWVISPGVVYGYRGRVMGPSSTLQDDIGVDSTREEDPRVRTVTRIQVDTSTLAIDVQRRLKARGYYRGVVDGVVGPGTRAAIADYQADHGLQPDGRMTQQVIDSLGL